MQQEKQTVILPLPEHLIGNMTDSTTVSRWYSSGLREIAAGHVALVLMAGGQGTRLGSHEPKGVYDIGLPSHRSLFQFQAERLAKLQQLAINENRIHDPLSENMVSIRWYIMTSRDTQTPTQAYFEYHAYFGLDPNQVVFFEQDQLPCVSPDSGKLLLRSRHEIHYAPNGNGGLYSALARKGVLADMEQHGIAWIHVVGVDNALVRVADPIFIGFCVERQTSCASQIVEKSDAHEAVGVYGMRNGKCQVVEYSELTESMAEKRDEHGRLVFRAANIVNHMFTRQFLAKIVDQEDDVLPFHVARKQIPCILISQSSSSCGGETKKFDDEPQPTKMPCLKFEQFVFDVFSMTERPAFLEIHREDSFAPVKNAPGSPQDSPDTARRAILDLHRRWLEQAGAILRPDSMGQLLCEVAPSLSYAGEGLEGLKGCIFQSPCLIPPLEECDETLENPTRQPDMTEEERQAGTWKRRILTSR